MAISRTITDGARAALWLDYWRLVLFPLGQARAEKDSPRRAAETDRVGRHRGVSG